MPAHHTLEEYLDAYIKAAGIADDTNGPLFRTAPGTGGLTPERPMRTADVWRMIRRRLQQAGIGTKAGCHSFRATGITCYLEWQGHAGEGPADGRPRQPQDDQALRPHQRQITLDEVEKIVI